jgi:squalene-associated FAD-dependent desaturase
MRDVIVVGGGLAGLAAAAALGGAGYRVQVLESRPFLGGRATSYALPGDSGEVIDNCQHVLLRCCVNLIDFYERLGVSDRIRFERKFYFIEPGGRTSILKSGMLLAPAHFAEAFLRLRFLDLKDKVSIGRGLLALRSEHRCRKDLDQITMLQWLQEKRQTPRAIERFWRQVLVSAVNEELDRMAALHGFQVFWLGFLAASDSYEMGLAAVPLGELYGADPWSRVPSVEIAFRTAADDIVFDSDAVSGIVVQGGLRKADFYILAVPFERVSGLAPQLEIDFSAFCHSPITGIHLWFDRPVTDLPHATLLDRTIQWMFNKGEGRYVQVVVSASRSLLEMPRNEVIELAVRELAEFFPAVREARLEKAHVVKEVRATFSASPGLEALRPETRTRYSNLFLAGDWTRSGWPATMEGAVRSGYLAAEAVTRAAGAPRGFLLPDIA